MRAPRDPARQECLPVERPLAFAPSSDLLLSSGRESSGISCAPGAPSPLRAAAASAVAPSRPRKTDRPRGTHRPLRDSVVTSRYFTTQPRAPQPVAAFSASWEAEGRYHYLRPKDASSPNEHFPMRMGNRFFNFSYSPTTRNPQFVELFERVARSESSPAADA